MTDQPWSTQPVTGAQHDAWMAEERAADELMKRYTWSPEIARIKGLRFEIERQYQIMEWEGVRGPRSIAS